MTWTCHAGATGAKLAAPPFVCLNCAPSPSRPSKATRPAARSFLLPLRRHNRPKQQQNLASFTAAATSRASQTTRAISQAFDCLAAPRPWSVNSHEAASQPNLVRRAANQPLVACLLAPTLHLSACQASPLLTSPLSIHHHRLPRRRPDIAHTSRIVFRIVARSLLSHLAIEHKPSPLQALAVG